MGGKQSLFGGKQFEENYEFVEQLDDARSNRAKIYRNKNSKEQILIYESQIDEQFVDEIKLRMKFGHPNILKLLEFGDPLQEGFTCSSRENVNVYLVSEWEINNLFFEYQDRIQTNCPYEEDELWTILEAVTSACLYLQRKNAFHGDLRPMNISIDDSGLIQINDHGMINDEKNAYAKMWTSKGKYKSFVSPEELDYLYTDTLEENTSFNRFKSDVFSLGMTMLMIATLKNIEQVYCFEKFCIYNGQVQKCLKEVRQMYGESLEHVIKSMINYDAQIRPTFEELATLIQNTRGYEQDYLKNGQCKKVSLVSQKRRALVKLDQSNKVNIFASGEIEKPDLIKVQASKALRNSSLKAELFKVNPSTLEINTSLPPPMKMLPEVQLRATPNTVLYTSDQYQSPVYLQYQQQKNYDGQNLHSSYYKKDNLSAYLPQSYYTLKNRDQLNQSLNQGNQQLDSSKILNNTSKYSEAWFQNKPITETRVQDQNKSLFETQNQENKSLYQPHNPDDDVKPLSGLNRSQLDNVQTSYLSPLRNNVASSFQKGSDNLSLDLRIQRALENSQNLMNKRKYDN